MRPAADSPCWVGRNNLFLCLSVCVVVVVWQDKGTAGDLLHQTASSAVRYAVCITSLAPPTRRLLLFSSQGQSSRMRCDAERAGPQQDNSQRGRTACNPASDRLLLALGTSLRGSAGFVLVGSAGRLARRLWDTVPEQGTAPGPPRRRAQTKRILPAFRPSSRLPQSLCHHPPLTRRHPQSPITLSLFWSGLNFLPAPKPTTTNTACSSLITTTRLHLFDSHTHSLCPAHHPPSAIPAAY